MKRSEKKRAGSSSETDQLDDGARVWNGKPFVSGKYVYTVACTIWLFAKKSDANAFLKNGGRCKHGRKHSCVNWCRGKCIGCWSPITKRWLESRRRSELWQYGDRKKPRGRCCGH